MKIIKRGAVLGSCLALLMVGSTITAYAGEWKQDEIGRKYQIEDGSYYSSSWQWIDTDGDGFSECYYFGDDEYVVTGTTIDGYQTNSDGAWVVDGEIQKQDTRDISLLLRGISISLWDLSEDTINALCSVIPGANSNYGMEHLDCGAQLGEWIYVVAHDEVPNDFDYTNVYILKVKEDGSAAQLLTNIPLTYTRVSGWSATISQGIMCLNRATFKENYSPFSMYYQYNLVTNEVYESSEEANEALKITGVYNSADNLYYSYDRDTFELVAYNVYGEEVYRNYIYIWASPSDGSASKPFVGTANGDIISFSIVVTYGGLSQPGKPAGQRINTVTLNKSTEEVINIDGADIKGVYFN